jgi:hypothetical protein
MSPADLNTPLTLTSHVDIAAKTSTVTATGLDISGYTGGLVCIQQVGTVSGTSPTLDGKWQSSTDNSTYTDISGATHAQVTASNSTTKTGFLPNAAAKYIRYVGTIAGTSPSFTMGVTILGQKQRV